MKLDEPKESNPLSRFRATSIYILLPAGLSFSTRQKHRLFAWFSQCSLSANQRVASHCAAALAGSFVISSWFFRISHRRPHPPFNSSRHGYCVRKRINRQSYREATSREWKKIFVFNHIDFFHIAKINTLSYDC